MSGGATVGPQRRCRICRTARAKADLQRWVYQDGGPVADPAQRLPGRGYYTCSPECASKLTMAVRHRRG